MPPLQRQKHGRNDSSPFGFSDCPLQGTHCLDFDSGRQASIGLAAISIRHIGVPDGPGGSEQAAPARPPGSGIPKRREHEVLRCRQRPIDGAGRDEHDFRQSSAAGARATVCLLVDGPHHPREAPRSTVSRAARTRLATARGDSMRRAAAPGFRRLRGARLVPAPRSAPSSFRLAA
jgi:hypothetical protein